MKVISALNFASLLLICYEIRDVYNTFVRHAAVYAEIRYTILQYRPEHNHLTGIYVCVCVCVYIYTVPMLYRYQICEDISRY